MTQAGTVIGTQTSWIGKKTNISKWDGEGALQAILDTQLYNFEFIEESFKTSTGAKPSYKGLIIDNEDLENNAWFARNLGIGRVQVLNEPNLFGYLLSGMKEQQDMINNLKSEKDKEISKLRNENFRAKQQIGQLESKLEKIESRFFDDTPIFN